MSILTIYIVLFFLGMAHYWMDVPAYLMIIHKLGLYLGTFCINFCLGNVLRVWLRTFIKDRKPNAVEQLCMVSRSIFNQKVNNLISFCSFCYFPVQVGSNWYLLCLRILVNKSKVIKLILQQKTYKMTWELMRLVSLQHYNK